LKHSKPLYKYIKGRVVSGLGEGSRYVSLYSEMFKKYLGFKPYPGTLNIMVENTTMSTDNIVKKIIIPPPGNGYASVYAYRAYIYGVEPVYVVKPMVTKHGSSVVEIVSRYYLRERYCLRDGSIVELLIMV